MKTITDPLDLMEIQKPPVWPIGLLAGVVWTTWIIWKIYFQDTVPGSHIWMGYLAGVAGVLMIGYTIYTNWWMHTKMKTFREVRHRAVMAFIFLQYNSPNDWIQNEEQARAAIAEAMKYVNKGKL